MRIVNGNDYFAGLERASEEKAGIECNLIVCRSTNYTGLAVGAEESIKKNIPIMEERVIVLDGILNREL